MEQQFSTEPPVETPRRSRRLLLVICALVVAIAAAGATFLVLSERPEPSVQTEVTETAGTRVTVANVETIAPPEQEVPSVVEITATVGQALEIPIALPQPARVIEVRVKPGQQVKKGDVLAVVEPASEALPGMAQELQRSVQGLGTLRAELAKATSELAALQQTAQDQQASADQAAAQVASAEEAQAKAQTLRSAQESAVEDQKTAVEEARKLAQEGILANNDLSAVEGKLASAEADLKSAVEAEAAAAASLKQAEEALAAQREAADKAKRTAQTAQEQVQAGQRVMAQQQKQALEGRDRLKSLSQDRPRLPLTAQADGKVGMVAAKAGKVAPPATPLLTIRAAGMAVLNAEIPQSQAAQIQPEMPVVVQPPGQKQDPLPGKVTAVAPSEKPRAKTSRLMLAVADPKNTLKPEQKIKARVMVGRTKGFVVPRQAVVAGPKGPAVWTVREGKAHLTPIVQAAEAGGAVAASGGIKAGDAVVVRTSGDLIEGMAVRARAMQQQASPGGRTNPPGSGNPLLDGLKLDQAPRTQ